MDTGYQQALSIASKKHDIIGVRVYDESEKGLKDIGLVAVKDAESDRTILLDTSTSAYRSAAQKAFQKITQDFTQNFMSSKADSIHIDTEMDYIVELQKFLKLEHYADETSIFYS